MEQDFTHKETIVPNATIMDLTTTHNASVTLASRDQLVMRPSLAQTTAQSAVHVRWVSVSANLATLAQIARCHCLAPMIALEMGSAGTDAAHVMQDMRAMTARTRSPEVNLLDSQSLS